MRKLQDTYNLVSSIVEDILETRTVPLSYITTSFGIEMGYNFFPRGEEILFPTVKSLDPKWGIVNRVPDRIASIEILRNGAVVAKWNQEIEYYHPEQVTVESVPLLVNRILEELEEKIINDQTKEP